MVATAKYATEPRSAVCVRPGGYDETGRIRFLQSGERRRRPSKPNVAANCGQSPQIRRPGLTNPSTRVFPDRTLGPAEKPIPGQDRAGGRRLGQPARQGTRSPVCRAFAYRSGVPLLRRVTCMRMVLTRGPALPYNRSFPIHVRARLCPASRVCEMEGSGIGVAWRSGGPSNDVRARPLGFAGGSGVLARRSCLDGAPRVWIRRHSLVSTAAESPRSERAIARRATDPRRADERLRREGCGRA